MHRNGYTALPPGHRVQPEHGDGLEGHRHRIVVAHRPRACPLGRIPTLCVLQVAVPAEGLQVLLHAPVVLGREYAGQGVYRLGWHGDIVAAVVGPGSHHHDAAGVGALLDSRRRHPVGRVAFAAQDRYPLAYRDGRALGQQTQPLLEGGGQHQQHAALRPWRLLTPPLPLVRAARASPAVIPLVHRLIPFHSLGDLHAP